ncbi:hypothetical protein EV143_102365 [Flavobacterium chryseum]|uniref:hypothetical protein n=1 Tax=Flavobacterium sp. P3160 TaxID=2512113 RepID=UPI00105FE0F0|nr:hypothetical protein [Flavobacterium sp. P3160]TDO83101.1 hypothetical protein EV143_102365 [Flavobacterium sp. P3160]
MKKLYLNTGGFNTIFNNLKERFNGDLTINDNEYTLTVQTKWAKGTISGKRFEKEMSYMHFDMVFYNDVSLSIESFQTSPIFFAYCEDGMLTHSFGENGNRKNLKKQQSGILSNKSSINSVLHFEGFKHTEFSLVSMPTTVDEEDDNYELASQLKEMFTDESGNYIYVGTGNSKIFEKLKEFRTTSQTGIVKNLLQKSILNTIVAIEIAQHSYNYITMITPILDLANKQFDELKRISNINIGEVFYSIGHLGKNYFPRLFKERYPQNSLAKTA